MEPRDLDALQARLGYRFGSRELLEQALTHRSLLNEPEGAGREDNERLEFLGDAVLGLAVARWLYENHPDWEEGEMTMARALVVAEPGLAEAADGLGLAAMLAIGKGEEKGGGRSKPSLKANALEALLGAVCVDGTAEQAIALVQRLFDPRLRALRRSDLQDPKGRLQEWLQSWGGPLPTYQRVGTQGPDHQKRFTVAVFVGDEEWGRGEGSSQREAERAAAGMALQTRGTPGLTG